MAGVVALPSTGIGGYGGVAIVGGLPGGSVAAIDFNGTAPMAMREDHYQAMGAAAKRLACRAGPAWVCQASWPACKSSWKCMVPGLWLESWNQPFRLRTTALNSPRPCRNKSQPTLNIFNAIQDLPGSSCTTARHRKQAASSEILTWRNCLNGWAKDGKVDAFYRGEFAEAIAKPVSATGRMVDQGRHACVRSAEG